MNLDTEQLKRWAASSGRFLVGYLDLLFAAALGITAGALGLAGALHGDHLTEATAALIGLLAFGVVRERFERHRLSQDIDTNIGLLAARKPWQVLSEDLKWDLTSRTQATATMKKEILIAQDEVFAIYEYQYVAPGREARNYRGGMKGGPQNPLPMIHEDFPGPDGRLYRLISLERVCRAGEIMEIESRRIMDGRFPARRENVSKEVAFPTTRLSFEIVWPADVKPRGLWIQQTGRADRMVPLTQLRKRDRRLYYRVDFGTPQPGERIALVWDW